VVVIVGAAGAVLSWALLRLIYLVTNLFYFHTVSARLVDPGTNTLGWTAIFLPVFGGLLCAALANGKKRSARKYHDEAFLAARITARVKFKTGFPI